MIRFDNFFQTQTYMTLRYIVINGIFVACLYYGFAEGMDGPLNVALAIGWITAVLGIIILLAFVADEEKMTAKIAEELEKKDAKFGMPKWFDVIFDIAVTITFLWFGHIFLSVLYGLHILGGIKVRNAKTMSLYNTLKNGVNKDE